MASNTPFKACPGTPSTYSTPALCPKLDHGGGCFVLRGDRLPRLGSHFRLALHLHRLPGTSIFADNLKLPFVPKVAAPIYIVRQIQHSDCLPEADVHPLQIRLNPVDFSVLLPACVLQNGQGD
jgi:hypothetical protein